jgi:hypothetical protein
MLNRATLRLALKIANEYAAAYAAYIEKRDSYNRRGYSWYPYCEHGTNTQSDYGCDECETGVTMGDGLTRRAFALSEAKARFPKLARITNAVAELEALGLSRALDYAAIDDHLCALVGRENMPTPF